MGVSQADQRPRGRSLPSSLASGFALGVLIALAMHLSQRAWFEARCLASLANPLPRSCAQAVFRLWVVPGSIGVFIGLVAGLRLRLGGWRRAWTASRDVTRRLVTWEASAGLAVLVAFVAAAVPLIAMFEARQGWKVLDPSFTGWLTGGDRAQTYLGSLLLRREPWSFPLGQLERVMAPEGTNAAFTDPVFLLALVAKAARGFLPAESQILGPWMFACYLAFAIGAALVAGRMVRPVLGRALAASLLALGHRQAETQGERRQEAAGAVLG